MSGSVIKVECRNCGAPIAADDINIDKLVAKCSQCHAVFGFDIQGGSSTKRERPSIAMPKGLTVDNEGGDLVISRSWRHPFLVVFMVVFTCFWNGMVWPFFLGTFDDGEWFITAFLSIFVFVGACVGYFTLAILLNTTEIRVSTRRLTVKSGPVPVPGNVEVDAGEIDQLWVEQKITTSSSSNSSSSSTSVSYPLYLRTKDGTRKALIRSSHDSEISLFLEQQIEDYLGIVDRAVRGEY